MQQKLRMRRVFRADERTFIVAMDHVGYMNEPIPELAAPASLVETCVENGADAIMTNHGTARRLGGALGSGGLVLSVNVTGSSGLEPIVEGALALGADALKVIAYPFRSSPEPTMEAVAWLGATCERWGLPLLVETIPGGWEGGPEMRTAGSLAAAARIAAQAGADFIKTFMVDEPGEFGTVVREAGVPVVILGGAATNDEKSLFQTVRDALDEGAAGVAIGRNIWGHAEPGLMVSALAKLIHEDATVEEALDTVGA